MTACRLGGSAIPSTLSGRDVDVTKFWNEAHARGVARGETLAMLLDRRPVPVGQPTAGSLPATVNPLRFLLANVLRTRCLIARIKAGALGAGALGLAYLRTLRRIIPPGTALVVLVELPTADDSVIVDYVTEDLGSYTALAVLEDTVDPTFVAEGPLDARAGECP